MEHGGDIYRKRVELDFSVNINPLGMPESVRRALCAAVEKSVCYPDIRAGKLRRAAADWCGVAEEELVFGNGASELFLAVVHAVRPKKILIPVMVVDYISLVPPKFSFTIAFNCATISKKSLFRSSVFTLILLPLIW